MRSAPRFSNWDVLSTGLLKRSDRARFRGASHRLLSGARRRRWPPWARMLSLVVFVAGLITLLIVFGGSAGWSTRGVGIGVMLLSTALIATVAARQFNYIPPPLVGLSCERTRLPRRVVRLLPATDDPALLTHELAREIAHRRRAWGDYLGLKKFTLQQFFSMMHYDRWARTLFYASMIANGLTPLSQKVADALSPALGLAPLCMGWFGFLCVYLRLLSLRKTARDSLEAAACPDCSYPLTGIPSALDPDITGGVRIGPDRCPECGSPWPLVPPLA